MRFEAKIGSSIPMQFNVNPDNEDFRPLTEATGGVKIHVQPPASATEIVLAGTIVNGWEIKGKLLGSTHNALGDWAAVAYADYGSGDVQIGDTVKWTTIAKYA